VRGSLRKAVANSVRGSIGEITLLYGFLESAKVLKNSDGLELTSGGGARRGAPAVCAGSGISC
jgi:hypothetical protein